MCIRDRSNIDIKLWLYFTKSLLSCSAITFGMNVQTLFYFIYFRVRKWTLNISFSTYKIWAKCATKYSTANSLRLSYQQIDLNEMTQAVCLTYCNNVKRHFPFLPLVKFNNPIFRFSHSFALTVQLYIYLYQAWNMGCGQMRRAQNTKRYLLLYYL